MISRHWKGVARTERAEEYIEHLRTDTLPALAKIPGFVRASILTRDVDAGIEFQVVTMWASLDSIRTFAGTDVDVETAVVPPLVREMMVSYDVKTLHYTVVGVFEEIEDEPHDHHHSGEQ
jgi:hypothetical protein